MPGPWLPAALTAGASLVGGMLGNKANRDESKRNRQFQERMRNTQWQSAVSDMTAAGINPALAYSQGPNASPGGSTASQSDIISPAVSGAMQMKRMQADLKLIREQQAKTRAEGEGAQATADLAKARLQAYGITPMILPSGARSLNMDVNPNDGLPMMFKEVAANIRATEERGRREGYTADTLRPMADLAGNLGQILPILGLLSGSGALRGLGGAFRKAPVRNYITKKEKLIQWVPRGGRR